MSKNIAIDEAIILAAGFGKRMQPLTFETPKPLVKLMGKPLIYYILEELRKNNIKKCFINIHYLPEKIISYVEQYEKIHKGIEILVIKEKEILDTGGAIKNIINKDTFKPIIAINGDSIIISKKSKSPLSSLIANYNLSNMDFLMLLDNFKNSIGYNGKGDFSYTNINKPSRVKRDLKKGLAYTGWQIINPKVINQIKKNKFSLNYCYDRAIDNNSFWGMLNTEKWLHIGTINALQDANMWMKSNK